MLGSADLRPMFWRLRGLLLRSLSGFGKLCQVGVTCYFVGRPILGDSSGSACQFPSPLLPQALVVPLGLLGSARLGAPGQFLPVGGLWVSGDRSGIVAAFPFVLVQSCLQAGALFTHCCVLTILPAICSVLFDFEQPRILHYCHAFSACKLLSCHLCCSIQSVWVRVQVAHWSRWSSVAPPVQRRGVRSPRQGRFEGWPWAAPQRAGSSGPRAGSGPCPCLSRGGHSP